MKTIHLTDEEADAIECALGIAISMSDGARVVALRDTMESAREKVAGPQKYEVITIYFDPNSGMPVILLERREFKQPE